MHGDTKFAPELNFTSPDIVAVKDFLGEHETEEIPCFTETFKHHYSEPDKAFGIFAEGKELTFTYPAYIEFCAVLGIPAKFVDRIPNHLLERCVEEMLDDTNQKVRLLVRDKNVISGVKSDHFVPANPATFLEAAEGPLNDHLFREASITDRGASLFYEPLALGTIKPDLGNAEDLYNVGVSFHLGYSVGLVEARPYSLRHICTNVAISSAEACQHRIVEKLRKGGSARYYGRLLENYTADTHKEWMQEVSNRLAKALKEPLTDWKYVESFSKLSRLLGKEVAWALLGVQQDRHDEIMLDVRVKKARDIFTQKDSTVLSDFQLYDVFNRVTAAGKTYQGTERIRLQEIGGELL